MGLFNNKKTDDHEIENIVNGCHALIDLIVDVMTYGVVNSFKPFVIENTVVLDPMALGHEYYHLDDTIALYCDKINYASSNYEMKPKKVIGIGGCDFTGKTTMVDKISMLGYKTIKQPNESTKINHLVDLLKLYKGYTPKNFVEKDNYKTAINLIKLLICFAFEVDRFKLLSHINSLDGDIVISDRTVLCNFFVNSDFSASMNVCLDDKIAHFIGIKKMDSIRLMYRKVFKMSMNVAKKYNYTIVYCSNFDTHETEEVFNKVNEARQLERTETVADIDRMDDNETLFNRSMQHDSTVKNVMENKKIQSILNIKPIGLSYFMDGDKALKAVLSIISDY